MSDKNERIQGGNEMVISTVLKPFFVLVSDILFCFGDAYVHNSIHIML